MFFGLEGRKCLIIATALVVVIPVKIKLNPWQSERQKVDAGVSLVVDYREGTDSIKQGLDRLYLANWEQFQMVKELIARYCPKAEALWSKK